MVTRSKNTHGVFIVILLWAAARAAETMTENAVANLIVYDKEGREGGEPRGGCGRGPTWFGIEANRIAIIYRWKCLGILAFITFIIFITFRMAVVADVAADRLPVANQNVADS